MFPRKTGHGPQVQVIFATEGDATIASEPGAVALRPAVALAAGSVVYLAIGLRGGQYTGLALLLLVGVWLALAWLAFTGRLTGAPLDRAAWVRAGLLPALIVVLGTLTLQHREYSRGAWWPVTIVLDLAAALAAAASLLPVMRGRALAWWLPAGLVVAAGVAQVRAAPLPQIDVWFVLQQSAEGLVHGKDMYRQHWVGSHGLQAVYPYLPITSVLLLPFRLLFSDVRYGLIAATTLASYLLHLRTLGDVRIPALVPLLVLVYPGYVFGVMNSWTEPLLVLALVVTVLAAESGHGATAVVALALALACKQHIWLLLPLAVWWPALGLRRAAAAAGLAVVLMAPWLIAGPHDFYHDTVTANLSLGVLRRSLSVPGFLERHGFTTSFVLLALGIVVAYLLAMRRQRRDASGFALGCALVLLTVDLLNKQSFFNHYTLPAALVTVAVVVR